VRLLRQTLDPIITLALPPRCPGCAVPIAADHQFCAACWQQLRFLSPPWCAGCNLPFDYDRGEGACCAQCLADPPVHQGVRAAVAYGPIARRLALKLKYGGKIGAATTMARAMARTLPDTADLLIPVPLHRWRLWSRGYNQALLIARALGKQTELPVDHRSLVRIRRTQVLRGMGGKQRRREMRGAFRVLDHAAVSGRHILLVDDVFTSGATTDACARALRRAGAASVTICCWARVVDRDGPTAVD
jgi:ComF family protein